METMSTTYFDDVVMEYASQLVLLQPPIERIGYKKVLLESLSNPEIPSEASRKAKLVEILYKDLLAKKGTVDFGKIPDTQGNITAFDGYENITKSLEILNTLFEGKKPEEYLITDRLHKIIVSSRSDFEFGFKFNVELLKLTYNTLFLTLLEMINICILKYIDYLKTAHAIDYETKLLNGKELIVVKTAKAFITAYDKGEWRTLVNSYKKDAKAIVGVVVAAPLIITAILFAIRQAVYLFYEAAAKVESYTRTEADFIAAYMERESN
jgi:hypothetical protein